ncbi:hypothetical protein M9H77_22513 [Catharanthus roseus]|uniref:Uncharacterized protein n=1 Tax=Catharanthus roseus TaxID=4058 RepID=A0ACC0AQP3_CATRO|nr:hypothetical protein M9H77_22513 [Catharanthus roseus]
MYGAQMLSRRSVRWHRGTVWRMWWPGGLASTPTGLDHSLNGEISGAKGKRGHIETGSPMLPDEQLMFEAANGSSKGHVYDFGNNLQSSPPSDREVAIAHHWFRWYLLRWPIIPASRGKEVVGIHVAGTG